MIALDFYDGENSLANHLSSPKGSACTRCVQMSLRLVPDVTVPGNQGRTAPRLWMCSRQCDPTGTTQYFLPSLRGAGRDAGTNAHSPAMGLMRDGWE
jgi:hypothetical protein